VEIEGGEEEERFGLTRLEIRARPVMRFKSTSLMATGLASRFSSRRSMSKRTTSGRIIRARRKKRKMKAGTMG